MLPKNLRLRYLKRGRKLTFILQTADHQEEIEAYEGETIATALLASGIHHLRYTLKYGVPRTLFCAVGTCYDCVMEVNGQPYVRACSTFIESDMVVRLTKL